MMGISVLFFETVCLCARPECDVISKRESKSREVVMMVVLVGCLYEWREPRLFDSGQADEPAPRLR